MIYISMGAFIGAIIRYWLDQVTRQADRPIPIATGIVNLSGSFLVGCIIAIEPAQTWVMLLSIGFAGALTTFSTFSWEIVRLFQTGKWLTASLYSVTSIIGGIGAVFAGYFLFHSII